MAEVTIYKPHLVVTKATCWKCKRPFDIGALAGRRDGPEGERGLVYYVVNVDGEVREKIERVLGEGCWQRRASKQSKNTYWMNVCPTCKMHGGDFYAFEHEKGVFQPSQKREWKYHPLGEAAIIVSAEKWAPIAPVLKPQSAPLQAASNTEEQIEICGPDGALRKVPLSHYTDKMVPDMLRASWSNHDRLELILRGLLESKLITEPVKKSAKRLQSIHPDKVVSTLLYAEVLLAANDVEGARSVLDTRLAEAPREVSILDALAKVLVLLKQEHSAVDVMFKRFRLEPTVPVLAEIFATVLRLDGPAAYNVVADNVSKESWIAAIMTAGLVAPDRGKEHLLSECRRVLKMRIPENEKGDALYRVASACFGNGCSEEGLALVLPLYRPDVHGSDTGYLLIGALAKSKRSKEASELFAAVAAARFCRTSIPETAEVPGMGTKGEDGKPVPITKKTLAENFGSIVQDIWNSPEALSRVVLAALNVCITDEGIKKAVDHIRATDPNKRRANNLLAVYLFRCGKNAEALEAWKNCSPAGEEDPPLLYNLASVYANLGQIDEALDCLARAVRKDPWFEKAADDYVWLGEMFKGAEEGVRIRAAIETMRTCSQTNDSAKTHPLAIGAGSGEEPSGAPAPLDSPVAAVDSAAAQPQTLDSAPEVIPTPSSAPEEKGPAASSTSPLPADLPTNPDVPSADADPADSDQEIVTSGSYGAAEPSEEHGTYEPDESTSHGDDWLAPLKEPLPEAPDEVTATPDDDSGDQLRPEDRRRQQEAAPPAYPEDYPDEPPSIDTRDYSDPCGDKTTTPAPEPPEAERESNELNRQSDAYDLIQRLEVTLPSLPTHLARYRPDLRNFLEPSWPLSIVKRESGADGSGMGFPVVVDRAMKEASSGKEGWVPMFQINLAQDASGSWFGLAKAPGWLQMWVTGARTHDGNVPPSPKFVVRLVQQRIHGTPEVAYDKVAELVTPPLPIPEQAFPFANQAIKGLGFDIGDVTADPEALRQGIVNLRDQSKLDTEVAAQLLIWVETYRKARFGGRHKVGGRPEWRARAATLDLENYRWIQVIQVSSHEHGDSSTWIHWGGARRKERFHWMLGLPYAENGTPQVCWIWS